MINIYSNNGETEVTFCGDASEVMNDCKEGVAHFFDVFREKCSESGLTDAEIGGALDDLTETLFRRCWRNKR